MVVQGDQTQPGLVCLNEAEFFRVGEKNGLQSMIPAEVHFFSYSKKCCFFQTNQARLGLVALDLNNHYV